MRVLLAAAWAALAAGAVMAQPGEGSRPGTDVQFWPSLSAEIKPFRRKDAKDTQMRFFRDLRASGELGWKFNEGAAQLKQFNIDAGISYPLFKFMRLGAEYRYSIRDRYTTNRHRLDLQLWLKYKFDRLQADYRFEYEHSFRDVRKLRTLLRNRAGLGYNIPNWKLDPQVRVEAFTALHYTGNRLVGMRYDLGTEVNLNKRKTRSMEIAVRHDREMGIASPEHAWVLVVELANTFKQK